MSPSNMSKMSEHVAAIRKLVDDVHGRCSSTNIGHPCSSDIDPLLCRIKVECHVLREYLKDAMPFCTDDVII